MHELPVADVDADMGDRLGVDPVEKKVSFLNVVEIYRFRAGELLSRCTGYGDMIERIDVHHEAAAVETLRRTSAVAVGCADERECGFHDRVAHGRGAYHRRKIGAEEDHDRYCAGRRRRGSERP